MRTSPYRGPPPLRRPPSCFTVASVAVVRCDRRARRAAPAPLSRLELSSVQRGCRPTGHTHIHSQSGHTAVRDGQATAERETGGTNTHTAHSAQRKNDTDNARPHQRVGVTRPIDAHATSAARRLRLPARALAAHAPGSKRRASIFSNASISGPSTFSLSSPFS